MSEYTLVGRILIIEFNLHGMNDIVCTVYFIRLPRLVKYCQYNLIIDILYC